MLEHYTPVTTPFFCAQQATSLGPGKIYLQGFPFDGTACFRKGARLAPNAIREISDGIESYSPYHERDLEDYPFYDLGDLPCPNSDQQSWQQANRTFEETFKEINFKQKQIKLLTLGGEHSIPYAVIKKYLQDFSDLTILHLDAHADLRDGYEGFHYSHASIIRRVLDHFTPQHQLLQYGIRSGTKDEFHWMQQNGSRCSSLAELLQRLPQETPIYLTLDVDFFDPAFMPGTGTPEAGGETFSSFISIIKTLQQSNNLVGADVVELAPNLDPTGNSAVFAATLVREIALAMS
jgi:agmatinase